MSQKAIVKLTLEEREEFEEYLEIGRMSEGRLSLDFLEQWVRPSKELGIANLSLSPVITCHGSQ